MIYRKRTQKDVTDSKIIEIWNECLGEAKRLYPRYFENCTPELYMDNSCSHLGRCSYSVIDPYERNVDKIRYSRCIITVSSNLKQDYEQIRKTIVMNSVISLHRKNIIHIYGGFAQIKSAKDGATKQLFVQITKRSIKPFSKHQKELRLNIWFIAPAALQTGNIKVCAVS